MPELPPLPRLALICVLAVVGFVVGPFMDVWLWWRNRRRWEGDESVSRRYVERLPSGRGIHWAHPLLAGMLYPEGFWLRFGRRGPGVAIKHVRHYDPVFNDGPYGRKRTAVVGRVVVVQMLGSYRLDGEGR